MVSLRSDRAVRGADFFTSARIRVITSLARCPSLMMLPIASGGLTLQIWWSGIEPAQRGISVCDGPCERLIDFVGDGGRQFSHRHHAINMHQLRLSPSRDSSVRVRNASSARLPSVMSWIVPKMRRGRPDASIVTSPLLWNDAYIAIWPGPPGTLRRRTGRHAAPPPVPQSFLWIILRMDQFLMSQKDIGPSSGASPKMQ